MNTEVFREPTSPAKVKQEIDETFIFNAPLSQEHATSCQKVQNACKALADLIAQEVPEGKERTICVNNLLSCALFARHGITRRQVVLVGIAPSATPSSESAPVASTGTKHPNLSSLPKEERIKNRKYLISEERILQISNDISENMCRASRKELVEVVKYFGDLFDDAWQQNNRLTRDVGMILCNTGVGLMTLAKPAK